ncbi:MAG: transglycosylase domain-containing protein, partial [Actinomycetota bacterium]|nr:transglycosylase domain-containing protein [Actinomycetota bacterium]
PVVRGPRRTRGRRLGRLLARTLLVLVLAAFTGAATFVGGLLAAPVDFDRDLLPEPRPVLLLADDGRTPFAQVQPTIRRTPVPAAEIPLVLRQAVVSAEDERFLDHEGVDPLAIVRAAYRDLSGGRTQGGSTLTQQYVKNAYVGSDRTLLRKVREAALAVRLEREKDKDEILVDYLNALYLGNGVYGVQAASRYYFGVDVKDLALVRGTTRRDPLLALARASLLAGIAPAPSAWNPVANLETARARQKYTLNRMVINRFVTPQQASAAGTTRDVTPVRETPPEPPTAAPEFADLVRARLRRTVDDEDVLFRGGLRVRTSLDLDLQQAATEAVREVLPDDDDPQAAVVAVDIRNGDVKALTTLRRHPARTVEGRRPRPAVTGYRRNGLNLATNAYRSSGSTMKPFILARALQEGQSLDTTRYAPRCAPYRDTTERGQYCNAEASEQGTYTLRTALALSINTVFVPLANEVGRRDVRTTMLDSGVVPTDPDGPRRPLEPLDPDVESFGLGTTALVTPLSMASAYATLANHGVAQRPRLYDEVRTSTAPPAPARVLTRSAAPAGTRVLPADVADRVTEAMRDVVTRGTGRAAAREFEVFGKTGTTNDSKDAWFVGCARSPQNLCLAVWMGYEDGTCTGVQGRACGGMKDVNGVEQVYGGTLPAQVFSRTFDRLREIQAARSRGGG